MEATEKSLETASAAPVPAEECRPPGTPPGRWWGELQIPENRAARWRVGPLTLWVEHRLREWRLAFHRSAVEPGEAVAEVACPRELEELPEGAEVERVAAEGIDGRLRVTPALADRSIVARPDIPFRLLAGGETAFYVSTPLWLQVETVSPSDLLLDLPTHRPSDTWFGTSTRQGELCYSTRTSARLQLENVTLCAHCAVTKVRLHNRATGNLLLERFNLPVDSLSLFTSPDGLLWTQSVTVERETGGDLAGFRVDREPPPESRAAEEVAPPRRRRQGYLRRTLGGFLG